MLYCILLLCLFFPTSLCGQAIHYPPFAFYPRTGLYSQSFSDVFSGAINPAAMAGTGNASVGILTERRYGLAECNYLLLASQLSLLRGGIGFSVMHAGQNLFNETRVAMAYGRCLGRIDVGIQFEYYSLYAAGYGNAGSIGFSAGARWKINEQLHFGFSVHNPAGGYLGKARGEKLPAIYAAGLGYETSSQLFLQLECIKEEGHSVDALASIQYAFAKKFFCKAGFSSATLMPWLGLGWNWQPFRADIICGLHQQLGLSPGLQLIFNGIKKKS